MTRRRNHPDYIFSNSNKGIITSTDGIVSSALQVSEQCPRKALDFLARNNADREEPIMGPVIKKLESMTKEAELLETVADAEIDVSAMPCRKTWDTYDVALTALNDFRDLRGRHDKH